MIIIGDELEPLTDSTGIATASIGSSVDENNKDLVLKNKKDLILKKIILACFEDSPDPYLSTHTFGCYR